MPSEYALSLYSAITRLNVAKKGYTALYVRSDGNDAANGLTWDTALRTISEALDRAEPWTTIFVYPGTYEEEVVISTPDISLISPASDSTFIRAGEDKIPLTIEEGVTNCNIINFTVEASKTPDNTGAIELKGTRCVLKNIVVGNDGWNIHVSGNSNKISNISAISHAYASVIYISGNYNQVYGNVLSGGSQCQYGIVLVSGSSYNIIHDNYISYFKIDGLGSGIIIFSGATQNVIYHNNFFDNDANIKNYDLSSVIYENYYADHSNIDNGAGIATEPYTFTDGVDQRPMAQIDGWRGVNAPSTAHQVWKWSALDSYQTVQGTWSLSADSSQHLGVLLTNTSNTVNDEIAIPMLAYSTNMPLHLRCKTSADSGVISVIIDGEEQGTIDLYSSSTSYNVIKTINVEPPRRGMCALRIKISETGTGGGARAYISEVW